MHRTQKLLCAAVSILAAAVLATDAFSMEPDGKDGAVRLLTTVPIPGTKANTTNGNMYVFGETEDWVRLDTIAYQTSS